MCYRIGARERGISLGLLALAVMLGGPAGMHTVLFAQPPASTYEGEATELPPATSTQAKLPDAEEEVVSSQPQPAVEAAISGGEEPLMPVPDPIDSAPVAIEAASFKGVMPGVTTLTEVEQAWGPPKEMKRDERQLIGLYAVEPFDQVEVSFYQNRVASVVIRFDRTFPADAVAQQLELSAIRPVLVSNELGEILGQAYPERGVLFAFKPGAELGQPSREVAQVILEPIQAEPFLLRAETSLGGRYDLSLQDVKQALKLQPDSARAHWLHSRILVATGDYQGAVQAAAEAVRLEPADARYRATWAQILGQVGRLSEAVAQARKAVDTSGNRLHVKARALCLLGDLVASGAKPDYRQAIRYHMQAIEVAESLAGDRHPAVRLAAKEVLVDAHLGTAHDIAWGNWKQKEEAVTKWLARADAYAEDLVENEHGKAEHRFRVYTRALAAYVGVRGILDPDEWIKGAIQIGEELIAATDDPTQKAQLQWDLGMALYDALQIYQMRNDHDTALKYGEWAIDYLEQGHHQKQTPSSSYLLGRLYFRLGAIHAIRDENHRVAITWFDKATPLLRRPLPQEVFADLGRHGETFVSMGVSYWESGQHQKAIELTEEGVELMEQAVKEGTLEESALAVPYGNLAAMHRQLGSDAAAQRYEALANGKKRTQLR